MIKKYEGNSGVVLWKWFGICVEVWLLKTSVKPHTHPRQNSVLFFLFGNCELGVHEPGHFSRTKTVEGLILEAFDIKETYEHWINVHAPTVFINFSRFVNGVKPISAVDNFKIT